jgi:A-factor type gamma-butyrolactone 1'-reductase (1S-forming)
MLFTGKVVLVTGAGSGIGRAAALAFAAEGAQVVVSDRDHETATATEASIADTGGIAASFPADVSRESEVKELVAFTVSRFNGLDAAFNNAGIPGKVGPLEDLDPAEWDRIHGVDLRGVWLSMRYEIEYMRSHGGGAIVNTASVAGVVGNPGSAAYTAAKHGVIGLTRAAAGEYKTSRTRINAISPGLTRTALIDDLKRQRPEMAQTLGRNIPLGRPAEPSEVAEAAVWLASSKASFVHGHTLVVDGGFSIL